MRFLKWLNSSPPTITELNHYLDKVVEELLEKHQKVSNPDFEKELQELTGIGWKQIKNYKNHPKQNQVIAENSKVLEFCLEYRNKEKKFYSRKKALKLTSVVIGGVAILGLLFVALRPSTTVVFINEVVKSPPQKIDPELGHQLRFRYNPSRKIVLGFLKTDEILPKPQNCDPAGGQEKRCNIFIVEDGTRLVLHYLINNGILKGFTFSANNYHGVSDYDLTEEELNKKGFKLLDSSDQSGLKTYNYSNGREVLKILKAHFGQDKAINFFTVQYHVKDTSTQDDM